MPALVYGDLDLDAPVDVHGQEFAARDSVVRLVDACARHVAGRVDLLRGCSPAAHASRQRLVPNTWAGRGSALHSACPEARAGGVCPP